MDIRVMDILGNIKANPAFLKGAVILPYPGQRMTAMVAVPEKYFTEERGRSLEAELLALEDFLNDDAWEQAMIEAKMFTWVRFGYEQKTTTTNGAESTEKEK